MGYNHQYSLRLRRIIVNYHSMQLALKYAPIVRGHYLFREANSFPEAKLEENFELRGTDNVQLAEGPPRDLQIMVCSCVVPSKRVLLQIIFCSCVIGTTFSGGKWQIASLSCREVIKIWKQSWWSNDKTIIELGYHKISWFARVSQINYSVPQPSASANNWTAHHWQIMIFCSTSSNNC